jgi:hypothetical protein
MNDLPPLKKGCYVWKPENMFQGNISKIVRMMVDAKVGHVCIKVSDGYYTYPDIQPVANALREAGIIIGAWGYPYLKWIPLQEAIAIAKGALSINASYLLHDIEDRSSFFQWTNGSRYISKVRSLLPHMPMGLNSYWKPSWHTEIPWSKIRPYCDFEAPQIYSRGNDPVKMYDDSKAEFLKLSPKLPFRLPAGDMYFEGGVKPRPGDITKFLKKARYDMEAVGVVMWAADQRETTPELWEEFAAYDWEKDIVTTVPNPLPIPVDVPLYAAVVIADALYIRNRPDLSGTIVGSKKKGDRVTVYKIEGNWSCIDISKDWWMGSKYLNKL